MYLSVPCPVCCALLLLLLLLLQTFLPLDLRPKRTRAIRRALSKEQVG
jgi:hypothetical protein